MAGAIARLAIATLCVLGPAHADAQALPASTLLLVGVIMPEGSEPKAILEDTATHEQEIYPLGAQIGGVRLTKILRDRVVLTSNGGDVEVRLAGSAQPPPSPARPSGPPSRYGRRNLSNPQTYPGPARPTR
jgi:type II secretory pathway component PulC